MTQKSWPLLKNFVTSKTCHFSLKMYCPPPGIMDIRNMEDRYILNKIFRIDIDNRKTGSTDISLSERQRQVLCPEFWGHFDKGFSVQ